MPQSVRKSNWHEAPIAIYSDPIFFSKYKCKVGSRFISFGRRTHGEHFVCEEIWTFKPGPRGYTRHYVTTVQKLDDIVVLRSEKGYKQEMKFGYISYSAIWRLNE